MRSNLDTDRRSAEIGSLTNLMDLRAPDNVLYVVCTRYRQANKRCYANWMTGRDNTVRIVVYPFPRVHTDLITSPRDFLAELRELYNDDDRARRINFGIDGVLASYAA
jgi:hypothetical protein